jgi:hypothetical protein
MSILDACKIGDLIKVKFLLDKANLEEEEINGWRPLHA